MQLEELALIADVVLSPELAADLDGFVGASPTLMVRHAAGFEFLWESPPTPTPKMNRPFDTTSSVDTALATTTGGRSGSKLMALPIFSREVFPAKAARVIKPSVTGP